MIRADALWYWMRERQAIYLRRQQGLPRERWTQDPIFQSWAFCNVFREQDRVTVWVREHIREPHADHPHLWFLLALARQINWPDTLADILEHTTLPDTFVAEDVVEIMHARRASGLKVYTGAYMLRGDIQGGMADKPSYTCYKVLKPLWDLRHEALEILDSRPSLRHFHGWLTTFHGWGGFLAYEVVTDLRWTRYLREAPDTLSWANAGPGAIRGLNRIHGRPLTKQVRQEQANEEMHHLLTIANSTSSPLRPVITEPVEMRDIEHSLCEMDKYLRVAEGTGTPRSRFTPRS